MRRFDAIVVGASYAGLAAAAKMPGRNLLVLERHDSVVTKQRGSLGLLLPFGEKAEVQGDDLYLPDLDLFVEGGVRKRFRRMQVRGIRERADFNLKHDLVLLNEGRIKGALLRRIREKGAEVKVGAAVRDMDTDGKEVLVRTDQEYSSRILLGADGVGSVVARSLRFRRDRLAVVFQREGEWNRMDLDPETLLLQIDDARNYFVAFSLGDRTFAAVVQGTAPKQVPDDLESRLLDRAQRLGAGRLLSARGAVVRLLAPTTQAYRDNVLLSGDALASFGFSSITGALAMGSLAGQTMNRFLAGSRYALPDYQKNWRKQTGQGMLTKLRYAWPLWDRVNGQRIDRMLRAHQNSQGDSRSLARALPAMLWRLFV